jgi:hypothetical protein
VSTLPTTRGVFKGLSAVRSELAVSVRVGTTESGPLDTAPLHVPWISRDVTPPPPRRDETSSQQ